MTLCDFYDVNVRCSVVETVWTELTPDPEKTVDQRSMRIFQHKDAHPALKHSWVQKKEPLTPNLCNIARENEGGEFSADLDVQRP